MFSDVAASDEAGLKARIAELESRLRESDDTLRAIRRGEIDAVIVRNPCGVHQVYTLEIADRPYRDLVERMQDGALTIAQDGTICYCNGRISEMLGMPGRRLIGQKLQSYMSAKDAIRLSQTLNMQQGDRTRTELSLTAIDGRSIPIELSLNFFRHDGPTALLCGLITDLSVQKNHLREIAEAAARELALFGHSPDSLFIVRVETAADDPVFFCEAFNPAFQRLTGLRAQEVTGQHTDECLPPEIAEAIRQHYRHCMAAPRDIACADTCTLSIGGRDFESSATPVRNPDTGEVIRLVGSIRDVTERTILERTRRHSQKMEAIGRLSAGVAHDFNNILQGIVGGLEAVLAEVSEQSTAHKFANLAIGSAMRGASLTHYLLSYARKQVLQPQLVEMSRFLDEFHTLLARTLGPHIAVRVRADHGAMARVDPGQLQTSLLNLAINASHAMPQGGRLSIDAGTEASDEQNWVRITVTDTGTGMDQATLEQAVDPFFTTKGLDGTGLGLSMVQGFAEQSGGKFAISSILQKGTTVTLHLPLARPGNPREAQQSVAVRRNLGRLLLVDDSTDVLVTTGLFLEKAGFLVTRAESGDQALAILSERDDFDVVVTDYAMPGLNGADLITEARAIRPGLKSVLITGFAAAGDADTLPFGTLVLYKPFKGCKLVEAVQSLMPQMAQIRQ